MLRAWTVGALGLAMVALVGCGRGGQAAPLASAQGAGAANFAAAGSPVEGELMLAEQDLSALPKGWQELDRVDFGGLHFRLVGGAKGPLAGALALLRGRPGLVAAEANRVVCALEGPAQVGSGVPLGPGFMPAVNGRSPNDEFLALQHGLLRTGAPAAWARSVGAGVTVAVVDTGIDPKHPELEGRVRLGTDFTFDPGWLGRRKDKDAALDDHGHGTHVAGIVGAAMGNGVGIAGVAPGVSLLGVKALNAQGKGSQWLVLKGVAHAVASGAQVVNLSLGGPIASSVERRFYEAVVRSGALLVAAAGNEGDGVCFPAAYPGVLAVGAVDEAGALAPFSNRGLSLGLVAPGVGVLSTSQQGRYELRSGTSMAAPFVSGAAALLWACHPDWSAQKVRATLLNSARDRGEAGPDAQFGQGELDIVAALAAD